MNENKQAILVIAEHDNNKLSLDTLRTLKAASEVATHEAGASIHVLVAGYQCGAVVEQLTGVADISEVLVADREEYQHQLAENVSELLAGLGKTYSHLLAPATTFGKNLMPRVAALLDVGQLADIVAVESSDTIIRPIYAGNALAKVQSLDLIKVITVRSSAFDAVECGSSRDVTVTAVNSVIQSDKSRFVSQQKTESTRPELPAAKVVVSGGRGVGSKENFALVESLADKLGGAIGASRAAVDAGFVSNDLQVGQTGKIVAPDLYIAVGISGAIQHLAGMKDSKVIVAINSDPEAAIFQIADYGLVGDLFEIMPELVNALD